MKSIDIEQTYNFIAKLLTVSPFDDFLLYEASIYTDVYMSIDGHLQKDAYSSDVYDALPTPRVARWSAIRPSVCSFLDYTSSTSYKAPYKLKLIFSLTKEQTKKIIAAANLSMDIDNVEGLFINIRLDDNHLQCITGTSLKSFTLDKSLENFFDTYTMNFITRFI